MGYFWAHLFRNFSKGKDIAEYDKFDWQLISLQRILAMNLKYLAMTILQWQKKKKQNKTNNMEDHINANEGMHTG